MTTVILGEWAGVLMSIDVWKFWAILRVVISWANGAWEVKGHVHAEVVRGVVDQFVRWYIGGVFRPRTDEADWYMHIFREHNTVADMHANWLMDTGDLWSRSAVGNTWSLRKVSESSTCGAVLRWG